MLHEGSLVERLRRWITPDVEGRPIFEVLPGPCECLVQEKKEEGRACVVCEVPPEHVAIAFYLHGQDGLFRFLRKVSNADGAILLVEPGGAVVGRIVECKKTVNPSDWDKAIKQFTWTLARLLAVAGALGVRITRISLSTAFREDRLSPEHSPNPALGKATLGTSHEDEADEAALNDARRRQLAWLSNQVSLPGFAGVFSHTKIQLDDAGDGRCELGS